MDINEAQRNVAKWLGIRARNLNNARFVADQERAAAGPRVFRGVSKQVGCYFLTLISAFRCSKYISTAPAD